MKQPHDLRILFLLLSLCGVAARAEDVRFNRDVRPILSEYCLACHGPDANKREAELRLDVEAVAKEQAIVSGKPDESELIKRLVHEDPEQRMPPAATGKVLRPEQIETLRLWISQGAPYEKHWSLVPPTQPEPRKVANSAWPRRPLDRFVLARLESNGWEPSPEADRHALLRRVTLDLTGLPPTMAEINDFVQDQSADAYEKVVDRLLRSDRYGEHMARLWLDGARYADTNGYQYDLEREQWVWRDWVIHAFNTNMPFDQFTVEQIAGDLLPNASDEQRLATAFHRNHPITIEGGVIDEEYRTEYVVDRLVTTSTVWLGLTMTCGRCHDHKFDPITQREFYQLLAFFNNSPDRGLNGFDPKLKVMSPLQAGEAARQQSQLEEARQQFDALAAAHATDFENWQQQLAKDTQDAWSIVVADRVVSQGGAEFKPQPDGSLLATGTNPATDVYEIDWPVLQPIRALRLEALTHESFVESGTGRSANANFVLSEIQVLGAAQSSPADFSPLKIASAQADYAQVNYPVAAAIDGAIDRAGWAVDGNTKHENRTATFVLEKPIEPTALEKVRIKLHFAWGASHQIGRLRLAMTAHPIANVPEDIRTIVGRDPATRSPADVSRLREYLAVRFGDASLREAIARVNQLRNELARFENVPGTMVLAEMPTPRTTHVLFRGEYDKPRDEVQPGVPAALPPLPTDFPKNRLGFARWLVLPDHPLTARVAVNRLWQQLFGTGIVKTAEDFGSQGEWPTHPELLDHLAVTLVESGWNVKGLLKEIVMSATYRQSATVSVDMQQRDPENRWLAHGPSGRLDAEVIRDSALHASGLMASGIGGPSAFPYHPAGLWEEINNRPGYSRIYQQDSGSNIYRRSLYTFWKRTVAPPSMAAFDAPDREFCQVRRSRTNTPLQAFVLLHDPQFVEAARQLAARVLTDSGSSTRERLEYGCLLSLSRRPNDHEVELLTQVVEDRQRQYRADPEAAARVLSVGEAPANPQFDSAELATWTTVARVLMNLSEFVTK